MMKTQFYITLPSNSSMQFFPDNKTCCYITQLPRTINLPGEWEVAIVEIQYPLTYLHPKKEEEVIRKIAPRADASEDPIVTRLEKDGSISQPWDQLTMTEETIEVYPKIPSLMFVYCDIIEPRIVGDVYAPLLRILQAKQNAVNGDTEVKTFSPPHYLPLLLSSFRTIEISIKDHQGKSIPFDHGTLTVTLHFKKIY